MQMDYINTSHPSFIGGSKAVELALQQNRIARQSATAKVDFLYLCLLIDCCICFPMCICLQDISELKDPLTERNSLPSKSRAILGRATQVDQVCIFSNSCVLKPSVQGCFNHIICLCLRQGTKPSNIQSDTSAGIVFCKSRLAFSLFPNCHQNFIISPLHLVNRWKREKGNKKFEICLAFSSFPKCHKVSLTL